ncbi:MAG: DMT family transporter [Armatimonadota bacterium]
MIKSRSFVKATLQAILAAALFSASTPFSKILLGKVDPLPLAALLYIGSGIGSLLFMFLRCIGQKCDEAEAPLERADIPWLVGATVAGGVVAPIILMVSLKVTPAATASMLFNFEGVATILIASLLFQEAAGRRIWTAIAFITGAGILLSLDTSGGWGISIGALGVIVACALWGLNNNLIRNISAKDPLKIVTIKGLCAGTFTLLLSMVLGRSFPSIPIILVALLIGSVSYGMCIMLSVLAMRSLGAGRTSAYFGTAPFIGAILSFILFREMPNIPFLLSVPLMIAGAILLLGENHCHVHKHLPMEHEHRHRHDDLHHNHTHEDGYCGHGAHSHKHKHELLVHTHPHAPDIHHRHDHSKITEHLIELDMESDNNCMVDTHNSVEEADIARQNN